MARPFKISERAAYDHKKKYITSRFTDQSDRGERVGGERALSRSTPLRQSARMNASRGDGIQETGTV